MVDDRVRTALSHFAAARYGPAVMLMRQAANDGDAEALFEYGVWLLVGQIVPRDLPAARQCLGLSSRAGNPQATEFYLALTANGSGGPSDWATALTTLRRCASQSRKLSEQLALLETLELDDCGNPRAIARPVDLVPSGAVRLVRGFASPEECHHAATTVQDILAPAMVVDPGSGQSIPHPIRTSDSAVIGPTREDLVVRALNLRISKTTATEVAQGEALTILRYRPGQQFRLHSDSIPGAANQRIMTALVYLNEDYDGGETVFPDHELTIRAKTGDALIFQNTGFDGQPDPAMRHAGLPVRSGMKWLATRWIRARPFSPWTGPDVAPPRA